jgi:hypothetical protein
MSSQKETELKAIEELRAMARVYRTHGFADKADELAALADAMALRLMRSERRDSVVEMDDYREAT